MGAPSVTFFVLLLSCLEKTALSSRLYARNPFFENLNLSSNSLSETQPGSSAPPPQIIVLPPGSEPANFDYQNLGNEQNPPRPIVISGYHYYPPYAQDYPSFYQPQPQIHPGIIQKPLQQEFVNEYPSRVNSGQINCHPSATLNVVSKPSSYGIEQHEQQQQVQQQLEIQQQQLLQQQQEQQIQQQLIQQKYPQQQVVQQQPAVQTQKLPTPHNSLRSFCATPRGQYPTNECNKYVNCWDDSVIEQYCPKGLVFNPKGYCDFSFNVECGRKPIVDVPLSTPIEVVVQQPNQQPNQQPTIIPISATWTPTTNPPPLQSLPIVSQPIQEPVVAEITTSTLPPVDPKLGAKCLKSRGQFPTDSCNKYINCWDGNAIEEECPEGLLFSTKGYCDYAFNVDCLGRTHSGVNKPVQPFYQPNQIHQVQPQENYGQSNPFLQTHFQGQSNQQAAQSHNFTQINQASNTNQVQSQEAGHYGSNPFLQSHLQGQSSQNTQSNQSNQVLQSTLNQVSSTNQIQAQQTGHYGTNPFLQSNNQQSQSSQNAQSSQNNLTQNNQSASNNFLQSNPFLQAHFQGQSNKNSLSTQSESHELQGYNKQSIDRTTNNLSQLDKQKNHSTIQHQTNNLAQSNNQQNHSSQTENKVQSNYQQSNQNAQTLQQHLQTTQTQSSQSNFNILSNHLIDQHQFLQPQSQYIVQPLNQYSPSYLALTNQPVQNYHLQSNYQSSQNAEINYTGTINGGIKECECLIDSGTFRNKNNCSQFYTCIDNKVVSKYECPAGLSFNDVIGVCDYSYRVDCTHEPYVYIPLKSNTFHKLPNEILQKVPAGLIDTKAGCNLGSVFKLNNECSIAAICKTGVVEIVECPTGFAYDSPSDKCLVPYLARC